MIQYRTLFFLIALAAAHAQPPKFQAAPDGTFIINGKREFLFGLYSLPNMPNAWKAAHDAGFHLAHSNPDKKELAEAHAAGMFTWVTVGSVGPAGADAKIRTLVETYKNDPTILWWETEDEPTYVYGKPKEIRVTADRLKETRTMVKKIDPSRPFYLNHSPTNLVSTLRRYNDASDILATDIYPVIPEGVRNLYALWEDGQQGDYADRELSQVGRYTDKMREVAGPSLPLLMVLQAFAWENFRKPKPDPKLIAYPNVHQSRFMAYQAIVHGANGILYFGLSDANAAMWDTLKTVVGEIRQLASVLTANKPKLPLKIYYHDTGHSLDYGIEWTARTTKGGTYVIAVNADKNPVEAEFSGLSCSGTRETLFSTAQPGNAKTWRELFQPFDVRVYKLTGCR